MVKHALKIVLKQVWPFFNIIHEIVKMIHLSNWKTNCLNVFYKEAATGGVL